MWSERSDMALYGVRTSSALQVLVSSRLLRNTHACRRHGTRGDGVAIDRVDRARTGSDGSRGRKRLFRANTAAAAHGKIARDAVVQGEARQGTPIDCLEAEFGDNRRALITDALRASIGRAGVGPG